MFHLHTFSRNEVGKGKKLGLCTQRLPLQGQRPLQRLGNPWLCYGPAGRGSYRRQKMALRQNSSKVVISSVVSEVRPARQVLSRRLCWATWMVRSVGTLVKRETTSKEIRVLSSLRVCKDINVAKSVELRTL